MQSGAKTIIHTTHNLQIGMWDQNDV